MMNLKEDIPEQCCGDMVLLGSDRLLIVETKLYSIEKIGEAQKKVVDELKKKHEIRKGSCEEAVLEYVGQSIAPDGIEEHVPFKVIYLKARRWPKSAVRRNIRKLESLGIVKRAWYSEFANEDLRRTAKTGEEILKKCGIFLYKGRHVIPQVYVFGDLLGETVSTKYAYLNENEDFKLCPVDVVVGEYVLKGKSDEEKRRIGLEVLRRTTQEPEAQTYTHEQRMTTVEKIREDASRLPHISRIYLGGSMANNKDNGTSDVDILVARERCPGYEKCGALLSDKPARVDIWCYTEDEYKEFERTNALLLFNPKILYSKESPEVQ